MVGRNSICAQPPSSSTGSPGRPFSAETPEVLVGLKLTGIYRPPHELNEEIPRKLSDVVVQLLEKSRMERPSSAAVLHDLLVAAEA